MRRHVLLGSYLVVMASMLASSGAAVNGAPAPRPEVPAPTYMNGRAGLAFDPQLSLAALANPDERPED